MPKTILCHCEDVEIGELYSALAQGYGDIETLKRYTGIGTGKCQGKCCFLQTLRILAALKSGAAGSGGTEPESVAAGRSPLKSGAAGWRAQRSEAAGSRPPQLAGDVGAIRVPTLRPPVLPLRIDDIVDGEWS
ncbi:MAG: (2Fe-2S)-binding protein [Candidatus Krumholzibacteria bacterium]